MSLRLCSYYGLPSGKTFESHEPYTASEVHTLLAFFVDKIYLNVV